MGFMYDPDNNWEINPKTGVASPLNGTAVDPRVANNNYRYYAKNGNYTYPDVNNMFLAAMDPTTGKVLIPSYYRPWLMNYTDPNTGKQTNLPPSTSDGSGNPQFAIDPSTGAEAATGISARMGFPSNSPNNVNNPITWMSAYGRLLLLRPRPVDNMVNVGGTWLSYFPYPKVNPDGTIGDVENTEGKPGGRQYDALWMDPDFPVRKWQGKNYKPLVALTIIDHDSRLNVNVAGNFFPLPDETTPGIGTNGQQPPAAYRQFVPPQYAHYSNMGVGMWEQNPGRIIRAYPQMTGIPAPGVTPTVAGVADDPQNPMWLANDAAYITRPKLAWKGNGDPAPPPMWKFVTPDVHNRFANNGVPNRRFYTYSNEFNVNPANGPIVVPKNQPSSGNGAAYYGPMDFNGYSSAWNATRWGDNGLPGTNHTTNVIFANPFLNEQNPPKPPPANLNYIPAMPNPTSRYDNGLYLVNGNGQPVYDERTNHPIMYNPFWMKPRTLSSPQGLDRTFGPEEMRFLNEKFNYVNTAPSMLAKLAPNTLGQSYYPANQLNQRFGITTLSEDLNFPGASPWLSGGPPQLAGTPSGPFNGTTGQYPTWTPQTLTPTDSTKPAPGVVPNPNGPPDFDQYYRANLVSLLGPVDLNRKLTDYRTVTSQPLSPTNVGNCVRALQDRQESRQGHLRPAPLRGDRGFAGGQSRHARHPGLQRPAVAGPARRQHRRFHRQRRHQHGVQLEQERPRDRRSQRLGLRGRASAAGIERDLHPVRGQPEGQLPAVPNAPREPASYDAVLAPVLD